MRTVDTQMSRNEARMRGEIPTQWQRQWYFADLAAASCGFAPVDRNAPLRDEDYNYIRSTHRRVVNEGMRGARLGHRRLFSYGAAA